LVAFDGEGVDGVMVGIDVVVENLSSKRSRWVGGEGEAKGVIVTEHVIEA